MSEICDSCGNPVTIGDWPFCPHGRSTLAVVPDDVPGGFVAENGFATPRRFYSHSAHERALAEAGAEIRAYHMGPHDKILSRWDTVDLDGARDILERVAREKAARLAANQTPITVTEGGTFREGDLDGERL